jgi:hypothetical protein
LLVNDVPMTMTTVLARGALGHAARTYDILFAELER